MGNIPKIGLDVGHGLKTSGKQTPNGIKEWTLNDKVRDKVVEKLSGYDVEIIHTDNNEGSVDESLTSRKAMYVNAKVDAAVSIHHNALGTTWSKATGVEVYVDNNATNEDLRLAECIYNRLVEYTGLTGRGVKRANFTVIYQNTVPAVLVEGGFMDGTHDYNIITSETGQDAYARAVAEGLIEFLNLQKKCGWVQDSTGWWYKNADGSYPVSAWKEINGEWYYFDERGYMVTGWKQIKGVWYYLEESGKMHIGWLDLNGTWYYLNQDGAMLIKWQLIGGLWYYFNNDGEMLTGWQSIDNAWYYLDTNGAMYASRWITSNGKDYYLTASGAMATSCYVKSASANIYYWVNKDGVWEPEWNTSTPNLTKYYVAV